MIRGIGIDAVTISEMSGIAERLGGGVLSRMFTAAELEASRKSSEPSAYLATRFAVKEAVFKAVAHLTNEKSFDFRLIETLNRGDGSPYINTDGALREVLERAGVGELFVSITTEGDMAAAFVIAGAP